MLEVKNLVKIYGGGKMPFTALKGLNINFGASGLVVVLGKSGCGKSTLLNILGGLDKPTDGEVIINGRSNRTFSTAEYDAYRNTYVGIVFQEFNLIDDITVFENIDMTLKLQEKSADVNTVDEVLAMVGLSNLGYRKPNELSGGQRQRVALARALLKKPEIILADEPTGSLDSNTSEEVFDSLKKISETKLVIVVTHDRDLANTYGERIIELVDGNIVSDVERARDETRRSKNLCDNVIEVPSSGKLTAEEVNSRLERGKLNFLGISHDKDRIALAYPETVDTFYAPAAEIKHYPTDHSKIVPDGKPFRLSRGKLPLREAIKMARANIKRRKKRYNFISVLTMLCFGIMTISIMLGLLNIPNLVANSAFDNHAQPLVGVAGANETPYGDRQISMLGESDIPKITPIIGNNYAKYYSKSMSILWAAKTVSMDFGYYDGWGNGWYNESMGFKINKLNGILETNDISALGMELIPNGGRTSCNSFYELIISDMTAWELTHSGFIGYDSNGQFGIHYPETLQDIVGCSFKIRQTDKYYTVAGIFRTNFEDYRSVITATPFDSAATKLSTKLNENLRFLFMKAFAKPGFMDIYRAGDTVSGNTNQFINIGMISNSKSFYFSETAENIAYSPENFTMPDQEGNIFEWVRSGITLDSDGRPASLAENQIILSRSSVAMLFDINNYYNLTTAEFVSDPIFVSNINKQIDTQLYLRNNTIFIDAQIVAIYNDISTYGRQFQFNPDLVASIAGDGNGFEGLYFPRGMTRSALESKLSALHETGYYTFSAAAAPEGIISIENFIGTVGTVFMTMSLALGGFAFLMIFNYMSASVRFRTKEIAVYRVVGAKSFDVSKIFLAEGGFLAIKTTISASIIALFLVWMLNSIIDGMTYYFGINFSLLVFTPLHLIGILLLSAAFIAISSIVPITNITRKKPIDAVKMV